TAGRYGYHRCPRNPGRGALRLACAGADRGPARRGRVLERVGLRLSGWRTQDRSLVAVPREHPGGGGVDLGGEPVGWGRVSRLVVCDLAQPGGAVAPALESDRPPDRSPPVGGPRNEQRQ